MQLTKASRYGLYALVMMARAPEGRVTASDVAAQLAISEHHVSKVLQQLARAGIVAGARGAGGGYGLARAPDDVTMLEIVQCLEGARPPPACVGCELAGTDRCSAGGVACAVHGVLDELATDAYYTLESITIATLARDASGARIARAH